MYMTKMVFHTVTKTKERVREAGKEIESNAIFVLSKEKKTARR